MQAQRIPLAEPLRPSRSGVLALEGWGLKVHVHRGRLVVSDGLGPRRREGQFFRATCGLKRLVLIGRAGSVTLEALRWLNDVGASLVHVDADGTLLATSAPQGRDDPSLRRAQALTAGTPVGAAIARQILRDKLAGHARVLDRVRGSDAAKDAIAAALGEIERASTPRELMVVEAAAAAAYWEAWAGVDVPFVPKDRGGVPDHWRTFTRRASPLTGNPRLAANPANAILNYLYAILEAECRIACLAVGLDPGLGVLHADQASRDSMALDVMEAVRPEVDAYVLDVLQGHVFRARDFHETRPGSCRLLPPLTQHLAETASRWRRTAGPVVERIARALTGGTPSRARPLPTPLTQDNRSAGRVGLRRGPRRQSVVPVREIPRGCQSCGAPVRNRERMFCEGCLAEHQADKTARVMLSGRAALARLRAEGRDPSRTPEAVQKQVESKAATLKADFAWNAKHRERPEPEAFAREIAPGLRDVPLRDLVKATGLSRAQCGQIRAGKKVPHPRHWDALRGLA